MKSVRIQSFSGPYFPSFEPNSLRIQAECGKIRTRKTPNIDTFLAVRRFHFVLSENFNPILTIAEQEHFKKLWGKPVFNQIFSLCTVFCFDSYTYLVRYGGTQWARWSKWNSKHVWKSLWLIQNLKTFISFDIYWCSTFNWKRLTNNPLFLLTTWMALKNFCFPLPLN